MGWFRSAKMEYYSIAIPQNSSHKILCALGKLGAVQFVDLNQDLTAFQRRFVDQVKKCNAMQNQLRFFEEEIKKLEVPIPDLLDAVNPLDGETAADSLSNLEEVLKENEDDMRTFTENQRELRRVYNGCLEKKYVYREIMNNQADRTLTDEAETVGASGVKFSYLAGVIDAEEKVSFAKMIFRASRGNCFVRFEDINEDMDEDGDVTSDGENKALNVARGTANRVVNVMKGGAHDGTVALKFTDPDTGEEVEKCVFVAMFSSETIERSLRKICAAYGANVYDVPDEESGSLSTLVEEADAEIADAFALLEKTNRAAIRKARNLSKRLNGWKLHVGTELAIYHTLNKFKVLPNSGVVVGKGWVIAEKIDELREVVRASGGQDSKAVISRLPTPWPQEPTHFFTNKYIENFQGMTNTYGVPVYGEANPALFTSVTFPFLFAMMFGDFGHGFCWFVIAVLLCAFEKSLERKSYDEGPLGMLLRARYMILMMSIFAMYCGLIYNETFALPMNLFGKWACPEGSPRANDCPGGWDTRAYYANGSDPVQVGVYPFGVDPQWGNSKNELSFENSLKMKLSVIFGIMQMTIGVFLKGANALYFKDYLTFGLEFIPQILFMVSLFWYMIFAIVYKWTQPWTDYQAPSLINTLINVALSPGTVDPVLFGNDQVEGVWGTCPPCPTEAGQKASGSCCTYVNNITSCGCYQQTVQNGLGILAVICIFWMLLPKPIVLICRNKTHHTSGHVEVGEDGHEEDGDIGEVADFLDSGGEGAEGEDHEEHGCMDIFIHQAIETIEYVLGCISNTASYLRLWALSLAHFELAKTFWDLVMEMSFGMPPAIQWLVMFVSWSAFFGISAAVLLAMDFLECFLHALRLHWVEFQNKFYKADGYPFQPFSYAAIKSNLVKEEVN